MRMWMCDPKIMCRKHLLGEHLETHMFLGAVKEGKKIKGFLKNNLFEPCSLFHRHDQLKYEMIRRGYKHKSELKNEEILHEMTYNDFNTLIDRNNALRTLLDRCSECRKRYEEII